MPLGGTRVDSLTGLRWFAAFGVFLFHARGYLKESTSAFEITAIGYEGVPFFFVLSGFVMTWVARPSDTPLQYYWRRFARIWPLLAVTTAATVALMAWWWHTPVSKADIVWTLTFAQAWSTEHFMTMNIVTWTLAVEAFFYLAFPLILRVLLRRSSALLAVLAVLCVAATASTRLIMVGLDKSPEVERLVVASPIALTPMFLLGVCVGLLVRRGWRPPFGVGVATALTAGTILLCWLWIRHPQALHPYTGTFGFFDAVLMPAFALLIATAALRDVQGRRSILRSRLLVKLGEWSFAYYLCHVVVLKVVAKLGYGPTTGLAANTMALAVAAVAALVVAALLHETVEKPAERRLRRLLSARRPRAV
ncbi:acyltransferase [Streptomyces roseicoloratus]|uniref:Acyltransferase n=1 Tax=Streptomyces roseicoloratus TaxID=2508722 RepID=A0ABY9RWA5_9ACTN|nr:acyltransferase [Streptomyces roseicoloratus]WMX46447.1 acyltransferase [Streptomyces roseicoloratus]